MEELEPFFNDLLLEDIIIQTTTKVLKRGTLKIYNTKQFYIRLNMEMKKTKAMKLYEIPFPFDIVKLDNGIVLDYRIYKMLNNEPYEDIKHELTDFKSRSQYFDKLLYIHPAHVDINDLIANYNKLLP